MGNNNLTEVTTVGIRVTAIVSPVSKTVSVAVSVVSGMSVVSTVVSGGGISISLGFGISGPLVELRKAIGGSGGGDVLEAGASGGTVIIRGIGSIRISGIGGISVSVD